MEQIDFSGLIRLTFPVIGADDWLLSDFPTDSGGCDCCQDGVLAETASEQGLVRGAWRIHFLNSKAKEKQSNVQFTERLFSEDTSHIVMFLLYSLWSRQIGT